MIMKRRPKKGDFTPTPHKLKTATIILNEGVEFTGIITNYDYEHQILGETGEFELTITIKGNKNDKR